MADAKFWQRRKGANAGFRIIKESSNSALFGIIEEGASVAAINADVNGGKTAITMFIQLLCSK